MLVTNTHFRSAIICAKLIGSVVLKGKGKAISHSMNQTEGTSVDRNEIVFISNFKFYAFRYSKKKKKKWRSLLSTLNEEGTTLCLICFLRYIIDLASADNSLMF